MKKLSFILFILAVSTSYGQDLKKLDITDERAASKRQKINANIEETNNLKTKAISDSMFSVIDTLNVMLVRFDTIKDGYNNVKGTLHWDTLYQTVTLNYGNNSSAQLAQEVNIFCHNVSGEDILEGQPVHLISHNSDEIRVGLATNLDTDKAYGCVGIATTDIPHGGFGRFCGLGQVKNLNTSAFSEEQLLWLGDGELVGSEPDTGHLITVGEVFRSHIDDGIIWVNIRFTSARDFRVLNEGGTDGVYITDNKVKSDTIQLGDKTLISVDSTLYVNHSIYYNTTYYDDLRIPIIATPGTANAPDLVRFRNSGIYQYGFSGTSLNEGVYIETQFTHRVKSNTLLHPHLHICPTTQPISTDTAVIEFEYSWAPYGSNMPVSDTITTKMALGGYNQWDHQLILMSEMISGFDNMESSVLIGRITRLQNHPSDTYTNDLIIFTLDIHYILDKPGGDPSVF